MAIKLVREFQQKQQVAITPQLKKSIDLLQLSRVEIISKIHAEAEDNPFLIKVACGERHQKLERNPKILHLFEFHFLAFL